MQLSELSYKPERAIIINCGTPLCTTLAVLSTLRYLNCQLLIIDYTAATIPVEDNAYLAGLAHEKQCEYISLPMQRHGDCLDQIFRELQSDYIYLVDSDVELLTSEVNILLKGIRSCLSTEQQQRCFGYGFVQAAKCMPPPCSIRTSQKECISPSLVYIAHILYKHWKMAIRLI